MKITRILAVLVIVGLAGNSFAVKQNDVVGYWAHNFQPGYNLVAFPVLPDSPTLQNVIGDRLGAVEVASYDPRMRNYRQASFNPETGQWSGNLFLLGRGDAYWIYIPGNEAKSLMITGHPEAYARFNWDQKGLGWQFYAPTYGKNEALANLPPIEPQDLLIAWDPSHNQFSLAEATADLEWHSVEFSQISPDRAYIALLHHQPPRQVGPPMEIEALYDRQANQIVDDPEGGNGDFHHPPEPLIVGNGGGLAICNPSGEPCNGALSVIVMRDRSRIGINGELEAISEAVGSYRVLADQAHAGRFNLALTIGEEANMLRPGDRIALVVRDGNGGETRSTSFEVPVDQRVISDVEFTDVLQAPSSPTTPREFSLSKPFPNPFNDRFSLEVRLPEASPVDISLYDISGREVTHRQIPLGAGSHRMNITADGIAAGIYLVRVTAGTNSGLVKIAHLK